MRISNLITKSKPIYFLLTSIFHSYFIKAIDHTFYGFIGGNNPLGMFGRTREKFVNHEPLIKESTSNANQTRLPANYRLWIIIWVTEGKGKHIQCSIVYSLLVKSDIKGPSEYCKIEKNSWQRNVQSRNNFFLTFENVGEKVKKRILPDDNCQ